MDLIGPTALFIFAILTICTAPAARGQPSAIHEKVTVPPGGYAWATVLPEGGVSEFRTVPVLTHGPWPSMRADLPALADSAVEACPELFREALFIRLSDLLYEDLDLGQPLQPAFLDVDGDGMEDLLLADTSGRLLSAYRFPDLQEMQTEGVSGDARTLMDITGDGLADSVHITEEGLLVVRSGHRPVLTMDGFDIPAISGSALGDMEGDGLADLVLGTVTGRVLVLRNTGTTYTPCFMPFRRSSRRVLPRPPGSFSSPEVIRSDSVLQFAVGSMNDGVTIYEAALGEGSISIVLMDTVHTDPEGTALNLTPLSVDRTAGDGLLFAGRDGTVYTLTGNGGTLGPSDIPSVPGTYPVLTSIDVNGDGAADLLAGTGEGGVFFLEGAEDGFHGDWLELPELSGIPSGAPEAWNDGVVFGTGEGSFIYFRRDEDGSWADMTSSSPFRDLDPGGYSVPSFADLNRDGTLEMMAGNADGGLTLYQLEAQPGADAPIFTETFSWSLQPGGAVSGLDSYYSRYYRPFTVLRTPAGEDIVSAYSREILNAPPAFRDEVSYCIANTPTEVLREMHGRGDTDLFRVNAGELHLMADALEYVSVFDSAGMSSCSLRTMDGWCRVDPEVYYRFMVHPRILFEVPARIDADYWTAPRDSSSTTLEEWLNHEPDSLFGGSGSHVFWREFIPRDSSGGEPLMMRMERASTYEEAVLRICNFQSHSQPEGMMSFGYSTNDLQPMVIYRKAYGSCGEQSILQTALCRTFMIPAYVVGCRGEDHQWAHYLHPGSGKWDHWDINYGLKGIGGIWVSGEGVDHGGKTISAITAFGPDNTVWPVTRSAIASPGSGYMSGDSGYTETADVMITVEDPAGRPVEGALVLARSHWENANSVSWFEYTDALGRCGFQLGWEPNGGYTFDVVSPFGTTGSLNTSFSEGERYSLTYNVPCTMPLPQQIDMPGSSSGIDTTVICRLYPVNYYANSLYSIELEEGEPATPGWTEWDVAASGGSILFMDGLNFRRYRNGLNCRAVDGPFIPEPGDTCYAVLDNRGAMFVWRVFDFPVEQRDRVTPAADVSWLRDTLAGPIPLVLPCLTGTDGPAAEQGHSWTYSLKDLQIFQDDPSDPLAAGHVTGPFRVPPGERLLQVETSTAVEGTDIDMFVFRDSDGNISVDGMEEMFSSSTTPTSAERVSLPVEDTTSVYWVYVQGWQVPEAPAAVDLGFSFHPEFVPVRDLEPTGYVASLPDSFSFRLAGPDPLCVPMLVFQGDTVRPVRTGDRWSVPAAVFPEDFMTGEVEVVTDGSEHLGTASWNVRVDSLPPELRQISLSVDTASMTCSVEIAAFDAVSGVMSLSVSSDSLPEVRCRSNDSTWTCSIDLLPAAGGTAELEFICSDSAGNAVTEPLTLPVPGRPLVVFGHAYPVRTVYDHRPVLQVRADTEHDPEELSASASLSDTSGAAVLEMGPAVLDGRLVQFLPREPLQDGHYRATVVLRGRLGEVLGEYSWSFEISTMNSTR